MTVTQRRSTSRRDERSVAYIRREECPAPLAQVRELPSHTLSSRERWQYNNLLGVP